MQTFINEILNTVFLGFSLFNIIRYLLRIELKHSSKIFDPRMTGVLDVFAKFAGTVYAGTLLFYLFQSFSQGRVYELSNRAFGPYWFAFWLPTLSFISPSLLWIRKLSEASIFKLLISILLLAFITYDDLLLLFTLLNRNYMPDSTGVIMNATIMKVIESVLELCLFLALAYIIKSKKVIHVK